jgi:hypothetical protein
MGTFNNSAPTAAQPKSDGKMDHPFNGARDRSQDGHVVETRERRSPKYRHIRDIEGRVCIADRRR